MLLFQNEAGSFLVPYEAELQTKRYCIVYDSRTDSLSDKGTLMISSAGPKLPIKVVITYMN